MASAREQQVTSSCTISTNEIFVQLHIRAFEEAKKAAGNYTIVNSMIEGDGPKAKFMGPGQHIIMATPTSDKLQKEEAFEAIKAYVSWFSGPDIASKITVDQLQAQTQPISKEDKDAEYKKRRDDIDIKNKAVESLDPVNSMLHALFEATEDKDKEIAADAKEKVTGYYITYKTELGDQKESTLDTAWQRLKKWVKGFEFEVGNMKGSSNKFTVGDVANAFDSKTVDAGKLLASVQKQFGAKFSALHPIIEVFDTKTILNYLKKRLESGDAGMLKKVENALCIRITKNDKGYELIAKQDIADIVSRALESKTIKQMLIKPPKIGEGEVIYVNNYADDYKNQVDAKFKDAQKAKEDAAKTDEPTGAKPPTKESIAIINDLMTLILEDAAVDYMLEADSPERAEAKKKIKELKAQSNFVDVLSKFEADTDETFSDPQIKKMSTSDKGKNAGKPSYEDKAALVSVLKQDKIAMTLQAMKTEMLTKLADKLSSLAEQVSKDAETAKDDDYKAKTLKSQEDIANAITAGKNTDDVKEKQQEIRNVVDNLKDDKLAAKYSRKAVRDIINKQGGDAKKIIAALDDILDELEVVSRVERKDYTKYEDFFTKVSLQNILKEIKFRYIKYHCNELKERGYLKNYNYTFEVPENQNTIEKIEQIKWDDKKAQREAVRLYPEPVKDKDGHIVGVGTGHQDELSQFNGKSEAELKEILKATGKAPNTPVGKAIQRLYDELYRIANEIHLKDRKLVGSHLGKLVPGVNGLDDLKQKIDDPKSNLWNLGPGPILHKIKEMQDWLKTGDANKKDAVDSRRTDWDCYIIPMKFLKFAEPKADTRPDKDSK